MDLSQPLVPPIAPSAVYRVANLADLDALYDDPARGFIYSRDSHPNAVQLTNDINALENATWGVVAGSGMAALATAFLATCKPGQRIVAADQLYGRTLRLLNHLKTIGIQVEFLDALNLDAIKKSLQSPAAAVVVETISNPLLGVADLNSLAKLSHGVGAKLIVDNTFAGPTLRKPLDLGADLVMESLSKMMNGHSDVMLGYLGGRDIALKEGVADVVCTWGFFASPFDCWLASRGLGTLGLRMSAAEANAKRLAEWLKTRVKRVIYPGLANMLCFELPGRDAVDRFIKTSDIPFCPSLGHHETSLSYPWGTSHRAVSDEEKLRLGITPGLVRVSVGCEAFEDLERKMTRGL